MKKKIIIYLITLSFILGFPFFIFADDAVDLKYDNSWESRRYLIEGVYYLINNEDIDIAEKMFRKAILSNSFSNLSKSSEVQDQSKRVVAEAFYFLGKIYYKRSSLDAVKSASSIENIAWAKKYLEKAEEYGIVYDQLRPTLLHEINQKYPDIKPHTVKASQDKTKVIIETENLGSYKIDTIKVDKYTDTMEEKFQTNKEFDMAGGSRYKIKPDTDGKHSSIFGALAIMSAGLLIWLIRD